MFRRKRVIYVGDRLCDTLRQAAVFAGIPESSLQRRLKYGGKCFVKGVWITETPPKKEWEIIVGDIPERGKSLLRYSLGEHPVSRGLPEQWK